MDAIFSESAIAVTRFRRSASTTNPLGSTATQPSGGTPHPTRARRDGDAPRTGPAAERPRTPAPSSGRDPQRAVRERGNDAQAPPAGIGVLARDLTGTNSERLRYAALPLVLEGRWGPEPPERKSDSYRVPQTEAADRTRADSRQLVGAAARHQLPRFTSSCYWFGPLA